MSDQFPYVNSYFAVSIDGLNVGRFSECSGLTIERKFSEHPVGGEAASVLLPDAIAYGRITLKGGVDRGGVFFDWMNEDSLLPTRRSVMIVAYDRTNTAIETWVLQRALPAKWTGPALSTESPAVLVESLELVCEKISRL